MTIRLPKAPRTQNGRSGAWFQGASAALLLALVPYKDASLAKSPPPHGRHSRQGATIPTHRDHTDAPKLHAADAPPPFSPSCLCTHCQGAPAHLTATTRRVAELYSLSTYHTTTHAANAQPDKGGQGRREGRPSSVLPSRGRAGHLFVHGGPEPGLGVAYSSSRLCVASSCSRVL